MRVIDANGRRGRPGAACRPRARRATARSSCPAATWPRSCYEAARDDAELLFDDTIVTRCSQDGGGVDVTFERAAPRRFDLVIGADGLHSDRAPARLRPRAGLRAAHGRLGGDHAAGRAGRAPARRADVQHAGPARLDPPVARPARWSRSSSAARRSTDFDHRDTAQHKRIVTEAYAGAGWRVPELLERLQARRRPVFRLGQPGPAAVLGAGRVALLGDAASCVSLFGDGSSLAMAGAHTLATALAASRPDHAAAFAALRGGAPRPHRRQAARRRPRHGDAGPKTSLGIATRNVAARVLLSHR